MIKKDIKSFTYEELREIITDIKLPAYRTDQIFKWLHQKYATSFRDMANLPRTLRDELGKCFFTGKVEFCECLKSNDGTEKYLFKLEDANHIETVFIPSRERKTVCVSTQVGCKFACRFCASGSSGFIRNLTPSEIIDQMYYLRYNLGYKITNCVFMGMGEPLDNYENVTCAIMIINDPRGLALGARRITVSTCGIIPGIEKLADFPLQVNLSLSLHAASNSLRDSLVPINKKYPLERLIKACEEFLDKTSRMITLEYVLLKGVNDSVRDAEELVNIAKRLKAKVNLIPCSSLSGSDFNAPRMEIMDKFIKVLTKKRINAVLRRSKGSDIMAACGQLTGKITESCRSPII